MHAPDSPRVNEPRGSATSDERSRIPSRALRRLIALVSLLVAVDLTLWSAIVPLLPHYRAELGLTRVESGWLLAAFSLAVVVTAVPVGHLADRIGARRVVAGGAAAMAAATLGLGFAGSFWVLLAARAVQGVGDAAVWGAGVAWVAARAPAEHRGQAVSYSNAAAITGVIAGPFVGGVATSTFGIQATFSVVAAISLVLAGWALVEPDAQAGPDRHVGVRAAIAAAFSESLILASVVMILAVAVIGGALQVLVPLRLAAEGIERSGIGAVYSLGAMLGAVAILLTGRAGDRFGRIPLAACACTALAVLSGLLALPFGAALVIAVTMAAGPVQSILYAVGYPLSADGADRARLGHGIAIGIVNLTWGIGAVLGPIAGPGTAQVLGDRASYILLALLALAAAAAIAAPARRAGISSRPGRAAAPAAPSADRRTGSPP
jgi:MFS transporter, DHA1 family, solute carrier family 18 (vesicular amine transporter), member 1/2